MSIGDHVTQALGVQHHVHELMQQREQARAVVAAIEHDHRQFVEIQTHTAHLVDSDLAAAGREHQNAGRFDGRHPGVQMLVRVNRGHGDRQRLTSIKALRIRAAISASASSPDRGKRQAPGISRSSASASSSAKSRCVCARRNSS